MDRLEKILVFCWQTTPRNLRKIADLMEKKRDSISIGESLVVTNVHGENVRLEIALDTLSLTRSEGSKEE